jgi:hypothetical protein
MRHRRRAVWLLRRGVLLGWRVFGFSPVILVLFILRLVLRMQQHGGGGQRQAEHGASDNLSGYIHEICSLDGSRLLQSETLQSIVSFRPF